MRGGNLVKMLQFVKVEKKNEKKVKNNEILDKVHKPKFKLMTHLSNQHQGISINFCLAVLKMWLKELNNHPLEQKGKKDK